MPRNDCNSFWDFGRGMSASACTCLGSWFTPCWEITSPKKGMPVHLKRYLSLLAFKFVYLHTLSTLADVALWCLPCSSESAIKISSAILKTLDILLSSSSIFFWDMSCTGAAPNGNVYICTCQMDKKIW